MKYGILFLVFFICFQLIGQNQTSNCKVVSPKLQGEYTGECKNRLANGKGTARGQETYEGEFKSGIPHGEGKYVYENGSFYLGEFKAGLRHGEGRMYEFNKETNEIKAGKFGKWKEDEFIEEIFENKYKIIQNINTLSTLFDKVDEKSDRVEIMLGSRSVLQGININPSSGNFFMSGNNKAIIENCTFPLMVRMTYNAQKGVSSTTTVRLEFELESRGHWKINVNSQ